MTIYNRILNTIREKGAAYLMLLDPDRLEGEKIVEFSSACSENGVDGFLIGGSLLMSSNLESMITSVRKASTLPIILFPGSVSQLSPNADALLFLSLISGRNPEHLIGKHVIAAPMIKNIGIEPISTGYILIESGSVTTAEYISGSKPVPRNKPEIAVATALAAQYLGMKFIYLEAGSGAQDHVPFEMVRAVSSQIEIPVICGGGIRSPLTAAKMTANGAKIIVTGNFFENEKSWKIIGEFSAAVHSKNTILV